jgi:hypothetical protein
MKPILKWQRDQMAKELLLIQGHVSDPSCPCKTDGEKCLRKHLLTVEALAQETIPIEDSDARAEELGQLAVEAKQNRDEEEKNLCGQPPHFKAPLDVWARDWRKKFETLDCELKGKAKMHQEVTCQMRQEQKLICSCRPVKKDEKEAEMSICPACIAGLVQDPAPVTCPSVAKPEGG